MIRFILAAIFIIVSSGSVDAMALSMPHPEGVDKGLTLLRVSQSEKDMSDQGQELGIFPSTIKMIASLAFVLSGILLVYWVFKKFLWKGTTAFGGGNLIKTLATSYLGQKKAVSIIEVAGELLVLGISDNHVSLLTKIEDRTRIEEIRKACGHKHSSPSFEDRLKRVSLKFKGNKGKDMLSELTDSIQEKVNRLKGI